MLKIKSPTEIDHENSWFICAAACYLPGMVSILKKISFRCVDHKIVGTEGNSTSSDGMFCRSLFFRWFWVVRLTRSSLGKRRRAGSGKLVIHCNNTLSVVSWVDFAWLMRFSLNFRNDLLMTSGRQLFVWVPIHFIMFGCVWLFVKLHV